MTVIPFPYRHPFAATNLFSANHKVPVRGTFHSPTARTGTMTGCLRLNGLLVISDRLFATSVITGELLDADGAHIGLGSRRTTAPVEIARTADGIAATIGPVHIDLLGLTVNIPAFSIDPATALGDYLGSLLRETCQASSDRKGSCLSAIRSRRSYEHT